MDTVSLEGVPLQRVDPVLSGPTPGAQRWGVPVITRGEFSVIANTVELSFHPVPEPIATEPKLDPTSTHPVAVRPRAPEGREGAAAFSHGLGSG